MFSIIRQRRLTVEDEIGVPEQVRNPIYFDPAINNRAPPSEWKPLELPTNINGTEDSWPPVWYLERADQNNKVTSNSVKGMEKTTKPPSSSSSTIVTTALESVSEGTTTTSPIQTVETTTGLDPVEKPRTRISTAALARLCLFQNVCSQEAAEDYFRQIPSAITTTTVRTTTKVPSKPRRPRKRNPLLIAQLRACMEDSKYCNTDSFNKQRRMALEGVEERKKGNEEENSTRYFY